MLRFLADEDFDAWIVRGLRQRLPDLDLVEARDVDLRSAPDDLEYVARVATAADLEDQVLHLPL